jgi:hypothetical protein
MLIFRTWSKTRLLEKPLAGGRSSDIPGRAFKSIPAFYSAFIQIVIPEVPPIFFS